MDREEVKQIAEEIEKTDLGTDENNLTEEELNQLDVEDENEGFDENPDYYEDEEDAEEDDEEDEREVVQVTETVSIVKQPVITSVMVGAEVDSKGTVRPVCKGSIERHIDPETVETDEFDIISEDFDKLVEEVKVRIAQLKEELN
jgi:hypothetical protein